MNHDAANRRVTRFKGEMDQASYLTPASTVAGATIADYVTVIPTLPPACSSV